ncbi:MAG: class I SAM-dependent methyltransferase [candidate division WOR-3 bacterium]|nr:MAG: class I SAM-dependent methyltransferase [candidate division WOR-3 bacterium]
MSKQMAESFLTDEEYENWFSDLGGMRKRVAHALPVRPGMRILDLACGYGYFTAELARLDRSIHVTAIDLREYDVERAQETALERGVGPRVKALAMDATAMTFEDNMFDLVANFGGLEDIHMTRGEDGVKATFQEAARVLRPEAGFCFTAVPPEQARTPAQRLETEVFSFICGATWLTEARYKDMLGQAGFELEDRQVYTTGRKLTPKQAKKEMRFACDKVPEYYGIKTRSFDEAWARFGPEIQKHGLGQFSRMVLFRTAGTADS